MPVDAQMQLRERTGGYDLLGISQGDKLWIVFRAEALDVAKRLAAEEISKNRRRS